MFEHIKYYLKIHSGEIAIFAITTGILAGIAVAATGDIGQVFAGHRH